MIYQSYEQLVHNKEAWLEIKQIIIVIKSEELLETI